MTIITINQVCQQYGNNTILDNISLTLNSGINVLMGKSGSGKSTLLRMLGGVRPPNTTTPTKGTIHIDEVECVGPSNDAITVFQRYSNRPDLTVRQNIELPFKLGIWKNVSKEEIISRVDKVLSEVELSEKSNLYPNQLSGGQNQRVALGRALVVRPKILLMDEPFGALDPITRKGMQELLKNLVNVYQCLVVMVTHDNNEAINVANRIIVLSGTPARIGLDVKVDKSVYNYELSNKITEALK